MRLTLTALFLLGTGCLYEPLPRTDGSRAGHRIKSQVSQEAGQQFLAKWPELCLLTSQSDQCASIFTTVHLAGQKAAEQSTFHAISVEPARYYTAVSVRQCRSAMTETMQYHSTAYLKSWFGSRQGQASSKSQTQVALFESAVLAGHLSGKSCSVRLVPVQIDGEDIENGLAIARSLID